MTLPDSRPLFDDAWLKTNLDNLEGLNLLHEHLLDIVSLVTQTIYLHAIGDPIQQKQKWDFQNERFYDADTGGKHDNGHGDCAAD